MGRELFTTVISYLTIAILIFREALLSKGSIGMLHDWNIPLYHEQLTCILVDILSSWCPNSLGYYTYKSNIFFNILLVIIDKFNVFSAPYIFKMSLVFIFFISGFSAYWLSRHLLKSSQKASFLAGFLYMLTPVTFTRVIVGYYYYLIGYALLPLVLYSFATGVKRKSIWHLLLCGFLYSISASQIQFIALIPITLAVYLLFERKHVLRGVISLIFVCFVFSLLQLPLIYYILDNFIYAESSLANIAGTSKFFWLYFFAPSISKALLLFGRDYEFLFLLYFQNKILFVPFLFAALCIPILSFSNFRVSKARFYVILALMALFLMKGPNPPFGQIYQWIYEAFPFSGLFRTSYHWSVLLALCYAVLIGVAYDEIKHALETREKLAIWIRNFIASSTLISLIYVGFVFSNHVMVAFSFEKRGIPIALLYMALLAGLFLLILVYFKANKIVDIMPNFEGTSVDGKLFFIFLAIILIYSWPVFSGDFAGRLQTYEYDDAYYDIYQYVQLDPDNFRVLWIPMTQPMVYKNSSYSGHDVLISYPPKPSFDQDLAHFSDGARYTAFLASIVNSRKTEYFGDILDYSSTKYVIYRRDVESVLPKYLPFGVVENFEWDKNASLEFLKHQKDVKLTKKVNKIYVFENDYTPLISNQRPVLVGGDLSTMIGLSYSKDVLGFDQLPTLLYLEDKNQKGYQDLAHTLILDGNSYFDLVVSFVDDQYKFDAGWYAKDLDARSGWTNSFSWWWHDPLMISQIEYGALSLDNDEILKIETDLPPGEYRILVKLRTSPGGSQLNFTSGENAANAVTCDVSESYNWHNLGNFNLTNGKIEIEGKGNNVVQRLLIVSQADLSAAIEKATEFIQKTNVILLFELERLDVSNSIQDFGSSQGYTRLSEEEELTLHFFAPKDDFYKILLRVANEKPSKLYFAIDDEKHELTVPSSDFRWIPLDNRTLKGGYHDLRISGSSTLDLDILLLKSKDTTDPISHVNLTYGQTNVSSCYTHTKDPSKYVVNVSTEDPVILAFNTAYHPHWVLHDFEGKVYEHYKINGYANGYSITECENQTLILEFAKQKMYLLTLAISQAIALFLGIYLVSKSFVSIYRKYK